MSVRDLPSSSDPTRDFLMYVRRLAIAASMAIAAVVPHSDALAQGTFPSKPLKFVVAYPPGGGNDLFARSTAPKLAELLGQSVVVENRPGANGQIAGQIVARAEPDGHTIMVEQSSIATNVLLYRKPLFDVRKDLAPIAWAATLDNAILVRADSEFATFADFLAYARANPGKVAYGSSGHGSSQHLAMELLAREAGIELHHVPFKGTPEVISSLVAGDVQAFLISAATAVRYTKDGRLKVIATTGTERSPLLPNVPTVAESGVGNYNYYTWLALFTTAGTPAPILEQLRGAFEKILSDRALLEQFSVQGWTIKGEGPETVTKLIHDDIGKYEKIVRDLNIRID